MSNAANTTTARLSTASGKVVHLGTVTDGAIMGLNCGSDRYRNARSRFVRHSDTEQVTCSKCDPAAAAAPAPAPVAPVVEFCEDGHRKTRDGHCWICED